MHPEPYLNYSQMSTWESSPSSYIKIYVDGKKLGTNRGMALGTVVAEAVENDEETGDALIDLVVAGLPKFEIRDKFMWMELKGKPPVPLRIRPDSCKADYTGLKEYKTGPKKNWNQKKVDENVQITFYATGLYILSGKIPDDIELVHAVTGLDEQRHPRLTGEIVRYPTKRTYADILKMMARMRKNWREIGEMVEKQLL